MFIFFISSYIFLLPPNCTERAGESALDLTNLNCLRFCIIETTYNSFL